MLALLLTLSCGNNEIPVLIGESIGSCSYESPFSGQQECRDYFDAELEGAETDCKELESSFVSGSPCEVEEVLGYCIFEQDGMQIRAAVEGTDASKCGSNRFGCETFANGYWQESSICSGVDEIVVLDDPFPQPERICVDPVEGEPVGLSEEGMVCTWQVVSGATEEGRRFSDYADCAVIQRQRPYSPVDPNPRAFEVDDRMEDPEYVEELSWVRGQMQSSACDCCHSALAPSGASVFDTDFDGNMANMFNDRGIAMGAGWIETVGFGTYPPEENNGFWRSSEENPHFSTMPSTDPDRMIAFFEAEAQYRGLDKADFENATYGAGPLDVQRFYEPEVCSPEEGVDKDGAIYWLPGRARYVYVLKVGSESPTVPPNLDTPEGTLWRVDLPAEGSPVASGSVVYGVVPEGMNQAYPQDGSPEALVEGEQYYLYAAADVMYPISRCLFTYGEPVKAQGCNTGTASGVGVFGAIVGLVGLMGRRGRK